MTQQDEQLADTWDTLTHCLESFIARWEDGAAPEIGACLPGEPAELRRLALLELIKIDLEYRSQRGALRRLEQYAAEYPELSLTELPGDLIFEEFHARKSAGENPAPEEYFERFPQQAERLRELLPLDDQTLAASRVYAASIEKEWLPGRQVDDFELLAELGKGAFARVFLARQCSLQRTVALKVSSDQGQEPQVLAQLDHPHIVRVYDQRQLADERVRLLYMQYAPGGTLEKVVAAARATPAEERSGQLLLHVVNASLAGGPAKPPPMSHQRRMLAQLSWPDTVCRLGAQLASGLAYAHAQGVLHRDIKPANILLSAEAAPKLADFNVSYSASLEGAAPEAYFGGSLAYMSPEQLEATNPKHSRTANDLDGRSDVYSLGVVLWELLFAERPFHDRALSSDWSETLEQMAQRRRTTPPEPPIEQARRAELAPLVKTLLRCMSPDPAQRPQSADEMMQELSLCLQPRAVQLLDAPRGLRRLVRRFPLTSFLLAALVPNLLVGAFNFFYNYSHVEQFLTNETARATFYQVAAVINLTAFPLGMAVCAALARPVLTALWGQSAGSPPDGELCRLARSRALHLGRIAAAVGVALWVIAGIAYPVSLHLLAPAATTEELADMYLEFLASLTLCGLMAAAYPFFGVTLLAVRAFYPPLLADKCNDEKAADQLNWIARRCVAYLPVAVAVPLIAAALYVFVGGLNRTVLLALVLAGLAGLGFAAAAYQAIQKDLAALVAILRTREGLGLEEMIDQSGAN